MIFWYLANEVLKFFKNFFYYWYVEVPYHFFLNFLNLLKNLEKKFALQITLENFFIPLWQDYTLVGRIISPFIRLAKIFVGGIIYLIFTLSSLLIIFIFELIPLILIYLTL